VITDFRPLPNDSPEVLACLAINAGTFDDFINALNAHEFTKFKVSIDKNKNFERIIDFVVGEMTATLNVEAYEYLVFPILMILLFSQGLGLGLFPRVRGLGLFPRFRAGTFPKGLGAGTFPKV
jgi:hypothetical protein